MEKFTVRLFAKNNGICPVEEFLDSLDNKMAAKVSSNITRVLYFFYVGQTIVLTNGFVKKTQKTPRAAIEQAKEYRKIFLEQEGRQ